MSRANNYTITTVRAAADLAGGAAVATSYVKCRGAKAVHFVVYSTTTDADAFVEPDLSVRVDAAQGAAASITSPATGSNGYGVIAPNAAGCVSQGQHGYCLSVYPDQPGTEVGSPVDQRIMGIDEIALIVNGHATNVISSVVVKAIVEY